MNFKQGDILVKNPQQGKTVWMNQRLIIDVLGVSDDLLRSTMRKRFKQSVQPCHRHHNILPDTGKSWRWAKINGQFYYDLSRIPNRKPTYYRNQFGDAETLVEQYNDAIKGSQKNLFELEFKNYVDGKYRDYLPCYFQHTKLQANALAKACAIIEFTIVSKENHEFKTSAHIYKLVAQLVDKYDYKYIGKQYRTLQQKVEKVENEGFSISDVIELPRAGNNNAVVYLDDSEIYGWSMQLRACGMNYSNETIIRMVSKQCQLVGKPEPSRRWFGTTIFEQHLTKYLTSAKRFGSGTTRGQAHQSYVPKQSAIHAGDCWQVDATRMNLVSHKRVVTTVDKSTGEVKEEKKDGFLFVIAIRDVHSGDVLGYNFDYSENRWSVSQALKMAVLEAGYLPYQIIFDRFPGHNTKEIQTLFENLEALGVKVEISHEANTKAAVERWFGTMQSVFMDGTAYYYGEGVKSRRDNAHRSPEVLKAMRQKANKEKFDFQGAWDECASIVEAYRTTPFSYYSRKHAKVNESPKMLHAKSDKPLVIDLKKHTVSMLFDYKTNFKVKKNGLILKEVLGMELYYQIDDYEVFSRYANVWMSYDLEDLNKVNLFDRNDNLWLYLGEATLQERPQLYGENPEYKKLAKIQQKHREIEAKKAAELDGIITLGSEVPMMMGQYTKKEEAEMTETAYLLEESNTSTISIKKAVGDNLNDSDNDSDDIDLNKLIINQY